MPLRNSIILMDAVAIKGAHDTGCWNALRQNYRLHSVKLCVEEVTRQNKQRKILVDRHYEELATELNLGQVTELARTTLKLKVGARIDLDPGETELLAYALTMPTDVWWLCGPDNGTLNALRILNLFSRMVSLEALAQPVGHDCGKFSPQFKEKWLADKRLQNLFEETK